LRQEEKLGENEATHYAEKLPGISYSVWTGNAASLFEERVKTTEVFFSNREEGSHPIRKRSNGRKKGNMAISERDPMFFHENGGGNRREPTGTKRNEIRKKNRNRDRWGYGPAFALKGGEGQKARPDSLTPKILQGEFKIQGGKFKAVGRRQGATIHSAISRKTRLRRSGGREGKREGGGSRFPNSYWQTTRDLRSRSVGQFRRRKKGSQMITGCTVTTYGRGRQFFSEGFDESSEFQSQNGICNKTLKEGWMRQSMGSGGRSSKRFQKSMGIQR